MLSHFDDKRLRFISKQFSIHPRTCLTAQPGRLARSFVWPARINFKNKNLRLPATKQTTEIFDIILF